MKTLNDVIVEKLCKVMGERDLTQYKLAQLSGVPFPTIKSIMQRSIVFLFLWQQKTRQNGRLFFLECDKSC